MAYVKLIDPDGNVGLVKEEFVDAYLAEGGRGELPLSGKVEHDPAWTRPKEDKK